MGQAFEVFSQRLCQLLLTNNALIEHQLLHRRQAVAEVSDADLQTGYPVILRAALLDALRALDAVIDQRRAENIVHVLFQHGVDHVLNLDRFARVVADLRIPVGQNLFKVVEVAF